MRFDKGSVRGLRISSQHAMQIVLSVTLCLLAIGSTRLSAQETNTEDELKKVESLFGEVKVVEKKPKPDSKKPDEEKDDDKEAKAVGAVANVRVPARALELQAGGAGQEIQDTLAKVVQVELAFLRRAVKLTKEQEDHLATLDAKWIKKNVRPPIDNVVNGVIVNFAGGRVSMTAVQKSVVKAIAKEMDPIFDSEQSQAYLDERKKRDRFVVESNIDGILLLLDRKLSLRDDQSQNIRKALLQSGVGETDVRMYIQNPNYLPPLPEASIVKHLDAIQKDVFRGLQQVEFGVQQENVEVVIKR